jgi:hypothetical protein
MLLKQSTARSVVVLLIDSADHVTGKTGLTLTLAASKDGAAFATITPTVTELSYGFYKLALTSTHTDTLGDLALHVTATGADPTDTVYQVVADLPGASVASVSGAVGSVTGAVGSVTTGVTVTTNNDKTGYALTSGERNSISDVVWDEATADHATAGTTGKRLADIATGTPPTAAAIRTEIDSNSTMLAAIAGYIDTEVAAIKAKTDNLPAAPAAVSDIPTATQNADALLKRDMSAVTGEAARSPLNALRWLRNRWGIAAGTLTVYKENDSDAAWTAATTQTASNPTTASDPA